MNILLVVLLCITGTLSQYERRPTDDVLYNRSIPGRTAYTLPADRAGVDGYIALRECAGPLGTVGDIVIVQWRDHSARMMIYDCSGDWPTTHWMLNNNIVGEIDYYTARSWGVPRLRGLTKATVCKP